MSVAVAVKASRRAVRPGGICYLYGEEEDGGEFCGAAISGAGTDNACVYLGRAP